MRIVGLYRSLQRINIGTTIVQYRFTKAWIVWVMSVALAASFVGTAFVGTTSGQGFGPGRGGRGGGPGSPGSDRLESSGLKIGSPMPEVKVFDAEGKPFDTASLKGKYSVVVFGCLT